MGRYIYCLRPHMGTYRCKFD